jgi:hypothetical protein
MLEWINGLGAVSAEALAEREGISTQSARSQLGAAKRAGLLSSHRTLAGQPTLYTLTRAGTRSLGDEGLAPCRVSGSNAQHLIVCARVAAALEHCYPDQVVLGERELRRREREAGAALASARLRDRRGVAEAILHRPDLVLWPAAPERGLPVAVEVELAVKAPERLASICRAWARCRKVAGAVYLATPAAERALGRAIASADASARVVVVPLDALPVSAVR